MRYARITGTVLSVDPVKRGKTERGPWAFQSVNVLMAEREVVSVTVDVMDNPAPGKGELVDWVVLLEIYRDKIIAKFACDWPEAE